MQNRRRIQEAEKNTAIEEAYRRGCHHGLSHAIGLIHDLLASGMPPGGVTELCRAFEQQVVVPWRSTATSSNSAPPRFDLEECQRLLREAKERQSA